MSTFRGLEGFMALGGYLIGSPLVDGIVAPGAQAMGMYGLPLTGVSGPGDSFIVGGNTYTVTSAFQAVSDNLLTNITFTPGAAGGGFSDSAPVTYLTNTILGTRNWSLTPSMAILNTTAQQLAWQTCRTGLAMWTGSFEALLDLTDPQQAALLTHLTGANPSTASVALFFGMQAGSPHGFYGMALVSSDTIPSPLRDLVSLTIDFASEGFLSVQGETTTTPCVAVPPALAASLVICLDLEEATGTRDDSVGVTNMTPLNGVAIRPGKGGYAARFVHTSWQSLTAGGNADTTRTGPFALAFWMKPGAFPAHHQVLLSQGNTTSTGFYDWLVVLLNTGHLSVSIGSGDAGFIASSTAVLTAGLWYFVVIWHDGASLYLEVNNSGVIDSAAGSVFTVGGSMSFNIGAIGHASAADHDGLRQFYNGDIDSVMIFEGLVPTAPQRASLWNDGDGVKCVCP